MRYPCIATFLVVLLWGSSSWGQFGLYGSPEIIRLPQVGHDLSQGYQYSLPSSTRPATPVSLEAASSAQPTAADRQLVPCDWHQQRYATEAGQPIDLHYARQLRRATPSRRATPPRQADSYYRPHPLNLAPTVAAVATMEAPRQAPPESLSPEKIPNIVTQLLHESGQCGPAACSQPGDCGCGLYDQAISEPCAADCASCMPGGCCPWYALGTGLIMGRDDPNRIWTTYESGNEPHQIPTDIGLEWRAGAEIRVGRRFCGCCCETWALEATYWTLDAFSGMAIRSHPNGVSTPLRVSEIEFNSVNGVVYFDNAAEHRFSRRNELHNIEINLLRDGLAYDPGLPWSAQWSLGLRYFRFEEDLIFASLQGGHSWGDNHGANEAYIDENITNNLVGVQFGCDLSYRCPYNVTLFATPKFGIYNNHIEQLFQVYRGDGVVANPTAVSGVTESYPVDSRIDCISFLTQIDLGLDWLITPNWSARIGYRAVIATGMGLADHQIPHYIVDIPEISMIDHNANLVLHGVFAGLTYNF